ncbi:MAG: HD domain-containing protein, partial [Pirellula sp.]
FVMVDSTPICALVLSNRFNTGKLNENCVCRRIDLMRNLSLIVQAIADAGGVAYQVGGCVRDQILNQPNKDLDIEVFHLDAESLTKILSRFGRVNEVGASFGVIKLHSSRYEEIDFTLPRRESKIGRGHRGFQVEVDHTMTVAEAARRRDFTMNAIYRNAHDLTLLDPHGGLTDLRNRVLRATSEHFAEDPLRVLRGMQFAARFNACMSRDTLEMCRSLSHEYSTLAIERVWIEWSKWALKGTVPSQGLRLLHDCGWIAHYPELAALCGVEQDPTWHPEGDVWVHTLHVCDAAARIAQREKLADDQRLILLFAALCHDLGKPSTTVNTNDRWRSPNHARVGVSVAQQFLARIGCPIAIVEVVLPLVAEHLIHIQSEATPRTVRRLSVRLGKASIVQLGRLVEADLSGRPPLPQERSEALERWLALAEQTNVSFNKPERIIQGRHLIELGYQPQKWFGAKLDECYEAQLDGKFDDQATGLAFLKAILG